jgi:exodeoxyribonuclease VII small subunit
MAAMSEKNSELEASVADLSYEQARDQLVEVVNTLEQGGASLEESIALWERGEALATRCEQWLDNARERLDKARHSADD